MSCPSVVTIQPTECIGNSLNTINNNYQALRVGVCDNQDQINALRTLLFDLSGAIQTTPSLSAGQVLQVVTQTTNLNQIGGAITSITDTGIPALTLTRKSTNSKILIDLVGGRAYTNSLAPTRTYFYALLNGVGSYANIDGSSRSVEYLDSVSGVWSTHNARYLYTPSSATTTIALKVYYSISSATSTFWHYVGTTAEPLILTMTEIAG